MTAGSHRIRALIRSQIVRRPLVKKILVKLLLRSGAIRLVQSRSAANAAPPCIASGGLRDFIIQSQLFDEAWYLQKYRDVADARLDPVTHYIEFGAGEGRNPNPLFDSAWYLSYYPDVAAAGANPLVHYVEYGSRVQEGRDPHPAFSTLYYLAQNPEIAASGINPLLHYLREGKAAGRLAFDPNANYVKHVIKERQRFALESSQILRHIDAMLYRPVFHVLITGPKGDGYTRTLESLGGQIYPAWSCSDFSWGDSASWLSELDENAFVMFLPAGDRLNLSGLYQLASAINACPTANIVYGDEDTIDGDGTRRMPFYKPDWSPDTLESLNYLGPAACFKCALAAKVVAEARGYFDFVLRATELCSRVEHVRAVVAHRAKGAAGPVTAEDHTADIAALTARLQRTRRTGDVTAVAPGYACYEARLELSSRPLISVIIPTAGTVTDLDGKPTDLLFNCLDKIAERSTYENLEFVIVDNGDLGEERVERLRERRCRRITFAERDFNVAKKLNLGASIASGAMLLLLNDDIEPLSPDWIERMLEQFEKPHVGAVGAKLLYSDLTVQHAGVATNLGNPEHVRKLRPRDDLGYFFSARSVRNYAAVTGACMLTPAPLYRRLGGYNEELAISYNDVDYCLKVREEGLTVVFAPGAELIHFESQSRISVLERGEGEYFHRRWARMVISDPYYNEDNLELLPASFEVKHNPRVL
jgi:GT2 family glycosyltransferase